MSTDECQGFEEAMRVCNELGFDVYVHPHENLEDVEKVVKEMNDSGHPCVDTKTMFLKSKKGELVMAVALLSTKTDMKRIQKESGTKDLRFAAADVLMENLHVVQGCVTPFCLVNNVDKKNIALILDKNLIESTVPLSMRPCRNDRTAAIPFAELKAFIDRLGYTYKEVDFEAEAPADEPATASPTTKKGGGAPKEKKQKSAAKPEKKEGDDAAAASE